MTLHPENYLYIYRDPRGYRDLKRELRLLPEEQREAFIMEMVRRRPAVGLRLANACMRNRAFFLRLLREGVCTADISRISMWLRCITPRLGAGRVLHEVRMRMDSQPDVADKVLYWMPMVLPRNSPRQQQNFIALKQLARSKGYLSGPQKPQGAS